MKNISDSVITFRLPYEMKSLLEIRAKASGKKLSAILKEILAKEFAPN